MSHYDLINGGLFSVASPRVAACGARQIARISMKFLVVVWALEFSNFDIDTVMN